MIIIKKLSILLAFAILVTVFAGCTKPIDTEHASPFAVYRINDKVQFTLGDKREDIEKVIDDFPSVIFEYEEDTPDDHIYEVVTYEYMSLGYDKAGNVLSLRLHNNEWQIANGLKVTDSVEDVKRKYPENQMYTYKENKDIYVSYDEKGNITDFSSESPFLIRFVIEDHAVSEIVILNNIDPYF